MKKRDLMARLDRFEDKYFDLVWVARRTDKDIEGNDGARTHFKRIVKQHAEEVEALAEDQSKWTHGFNSGCLATVRLIVGLLGNSDDAACAEETFPNCDT
jgi:hypothetical protein